MYQSFYKFTGKPFRLSPDPGFFFPSRGHKRALAYLRYGLNQDEGFVVITGAPGTGKTTLAKILLQELGDKNLVVAHITTTQLDADDMLRMVAASFGIRYEGLEKAALLKSLEQFLLARARERKRALLVIDEAQNLPERSLEELRMLSNLQAGDKALVQTFMLGQAQFRQMLDHPDLEQLRQRVIANYHLSPLAPDECQRYIESRLQQVNWKNDPNIAEIAYERIHEYTEGIPRRINMLCDRIMLYACMEDMHDITGEVVALVTQELEQEVSGEYIQQKSSDRLPIPSAAVEADAENMRTQSAEEVESFDVAENSRVLQPIEATQKSLDKYEKKSNEGSAKARQKAKSKSKKGKETNTVDELSKKVKGNSAGKTKAKVKSKDKEKEKKSPVEAPEKTDSHVMGNTVTRHKPAPFELESGRTSISPEIDERDLFRVIPGGKTDTQKPLPGSDNNTQGNPVAPAAQAQPSQEDVLLRRILRLVLAFHRSPSRFPGLDNANQPLPDGITELMELAVSDDQVLTQVSPAAVMGISPMMLRAAVRFFVRRAFFVVDSDDYRVLGLQSGASQGQVERHYDLLMRLLRQDKQRGSADSVERIGQAYEALGRLDQAVQPRQQQKAKAVEKQPPAAPVMPEPEVDPVDDGLTIDFEQVTARNARVERKSSFGKKPHEAINLDVVTSHKRIRYAGQLGVLGFGALVIVLGMYIVQLEPSTEGPGGDIVAQESGSVADIETISEARRNPLLFSDGTSGTGEASEAPELNRIDTDDSEVVIAALAPTAKPPVDVGRDTSDRIAFVDKTEKSSAPETPVKTASVPSRKSVNSRLPDIEFFDREKFPSGAEEGDFPKTVSAKKVQPNVIQIANPPESGSKKLSVAKLEPVKEKPLVTPQSYPGIDIEPAETSVKPASADTPSVMPSSAVVLSGSSIQPTQIAVPKPQAGFISITDKPSAGSVVAETPKTIQIAPVASTTTKANAKKSTISDTELNRFIGRFVTAYEKGDIKNVMALFSSNARTNNRTTHAGIKADYVDLFKSSSSREMKISSLFWEADNAHARGVGEYRARVKASGEKEAQIFIGKITAQINKRGNNLEMTRFYFSNQKVIADTSTATPAPVVAVVDKSISNAEIQKLMSNFIQFYEKGNLEGLTGLFQSNARTNDQSSRAGIKKDHADLFANTTVRKMSIKDMKWDMADSGAKGLGDFEVVIKAKGSDVLNTYTGTIKLQLSRSEDGVLFTQMIHNTQ